MMGKSCGSQRRGLCPVSLGLAVGLVWGIAVLVTSFSTVAMPAGADFYMALMGLIKGFGLGFFTALFYDLISCCCKCKCCKGSDDGQCSCGCSCCGSKPVAGS